VLLRAPILWGVVFGVIQAASPLGFWWPDPATVYALSLILIAAVYIGFAVADGRPTVIAVEAAIAAVFVIVAAAGVTGPAWLLVAGLTGHGFKDLWQHRSHFVANTRWWPVGCQKSGSPQSSGDVVAGYGAPWVPPSGWRCWWSGRSCIWRCAASLS
jgi:hypothetical protein